jgi:hypothetical protein
MTPMDLRVFCAALGFTAVVMQGGKVPKQEGTRRASEFAGLIEEHCQITVPEALEQGKEEEMQVVDLVTTKPEGKFGPAERMATAIVEIYREQGGCLPQDLLTKGFLNDEIVRHWAMANALAKIELNIMDS